MSASREPNIHTENFNDMILSVDNIKIKELDVRLLVDLEEEKRMKEETREQKAKENLEKAEMRQRRKEEIEFRKKKLEAEKEEKRLKREAERVKKEEERKLKEDERRFREEQKRKREEERDAKKQKDKEEQERKRRETEEREKERKEKKKREDETRKKQVSVMAKFLNLSGKISEFTVTSPTPTKPSQEKEKLLEPLFLPPPNQVRLLLPKPLTEEIDKSLGSNSCSDVTTLFRNHLENWTNKAVSQREKQRWCQRRIEKTDPIHESLTSNQEFLAVERKTEKEKHDCFPEDATILELENEKIMQKIIPVSRTMRLLQFHDNNRPAYYGNEKKISDFIKPRKPFGKDPKLDYAYDSDEDWEEEEPGEVLSDTEKDDEGSEIADDDEANDGFMVPDGYLSEDEGFNESVEANSLSSEKSASEVSRSILLMERMVDKALKANIPVVLFYPQRANAAQGSKQDDKKSRARTCVFGNPELLKELKSEILLETTAIETPGEEAATSNFIHSKGVENIPLERQRLVELAGILQTNCTSIKKTVDCLLPKFPELSKAQFEATIRALSEFDGSRWKVRDYFVKEFGLTAVVPKGIPTLLSKEPKPAKKRISPISVIQADAKTKELGLDGVLSSKSSTEKQ